MSKRSRADEETAQISSDEINSIINEVVLSKLPQKERALYFEKQYPEFAKVHGVLLNMACEPDFDFAQFKYMMEMREKIFAKEESVESASTKVGQSLFNEFVQPAMKK